MLEIVVVIDSLNPLVAAQPGFISAFLSSLITGMVSVVATYHSDVPLVLPKSFNEYESHPLVVLSHLATAIFRVSSLWQAIARRKAQNRSQQEPDFGLREGREGVMKGLRREDTEGDGLLLEMEMRRRSGRAVIERFILGRTDAATGLAAISLLSDHPAFAAVPDVEGNMAVEDTEEDMGTTFNLGLTDKQRQDREGVVLPYFDAQTDIGGGEGGRILYEMGREDDFDEEEDEI